MLTCHLTGMKPILLAFAAFAVAAPAKQDTDYPHRDWGQTLRLNMSAADATTCIARFLNRRGNVLVLPVEGGSDIDFAVKTLWGPKMEPWESYKVRADGQGATLRLFYRHPITQKSAGKDVARLQKACFAA